MTRNLLHITFWLKIILLGPIFKTHHSYIFRVKIQFTSKLPPPSRIQPTAVADKLLTKLDYYIRKECVNDEINHQSKKKEEEKSETNFGLSIKFHKIKNKKKTKTNWALLISNDGET